MTTRVRRLVPSRLRRAIVRLVAGPALAARDRTIEQLKAQHTSIRSETRTARRDADLARAAVEASDERVASLERSQQSAQMALTEARAALAAAEQAAAVNKIETKLHRQSERQLRSELQESQQLLRHLRSRLATSASLLSLNSEMATHAATEILRAARQETSRSLGEVFDAPSNQRRIRLRSLAQTETDFGRWSSSYATALSDRPSHGEPGGLLVVNDTRTQNNIGCRTTTSGLLGIIEAGGHDVLGRITLAELGLLAGELWARSGAAASVDNIELMVDVLTHDDGFEHLRRLVKASSGVIINGEGSIYDRQPKGLVLLALAMMSTERLGRAVALVNHSAELGDPVTAKWAERTFPVLAANAFRDPVSLARLPETARSPHDCWVPDAAFCVQPLAPDDDVLPSECALGADSVLGRPIPDEFVVMSGSSSLYRRDRTGHDPADAVADLCRQLMVNGHDVVLLESDKRDRQLLRPLAIELGLPYVSAANPVATFQQVFRRATCLISGRWHASIIAAVEGCPPILGDANFFKTEALQDMLELDWPMFDFHRLAERVDEVVATVAAISTDRQQLGKGLAGRASALANQSRSGLTAAVSEIGRRSPG